MFYRLKEKWLLVLVGVLALGAMVMWFILSVHIRQGSKFEGHINDWALKVATTTEKQQKHNTAKEYYLATAEYGIWEKKVNQDKIIYAISQDYQDVINSELIKDENWELAKSLNESKDMKLILFPQKKITIRNKDEIKFIELGDKSLKMWGKTYQKKDFRELDNRLKWYAISGTGIWPFTKEQANDIIRNYLPHREAYQVEGSDMYLLVHTNGWEYENANKTRGLLISLNNELNPTPPTPETPNNPTTPETPTTPNNPTTPENPTTPVTPTTPENPEYPEYPEYPPSPPPYDPFTWEDSYPNYEEETECNHPDEYQFKNQITLQCEDALTLHKNGYTILAHSQAPNNKKYPLRNDPYVKNPKNKRYYKIVNNKYEIQDAIRRDELVVTSRVTDMSFVFRNMFQYKQDLRHWDTSNVTNMSYMFTWPVNKWWFEGIEKWYTWNVENMEWMFQDNTFFNSDISNWNVSNVTNFSRMFQWAKNFNQEIGQWQTRSAKKTMWMFMNAVKFNAHIGNWNLSNVTDASYMFKWASSFNKMIVWDMKSAETLRWMFKDATAFNQSMQYFRIGNAKTLQEMFQWASSFNQPLNNWDVSKVKSIEDMFYMAFSFNQDLSNWHFPKSMWKQHYWQGMKQWTKSKPQFDLD